MSSDSPRQDTLIYFRRNGGNIIGDRRAIENAKREQQRDIIECGRLGSYDEKGEYIISNPIKQELIGLTKYVYNTSLKDVLRKSHDIYYLYSNLPGFDRLEYILDIGEGYASLYLSEKVYKEGNQYFDIYEENILNFPIDNKMTLDYIFNVLKVKPTDDGGKRYIHENVENILIRKLYLKSVSDNVRESSVKVERESFEEAIAILKEAGPYGEKVLKAFVEKLSDRQEVIEKKDTPDYNKSLNDILIGVMELVTTEEDIKSSANKAVYRQVSMLRNERIEPIIEEAKASVTPVEVKGKYFETAKEDLPIETVTEVCDELRADAYVGQAPRRDVPIPVKGIVSISKEQLVAEKLDAKVKEAQRESKVETSKTTTATTKAVAEDQTSTQDVLDEVSGQDDTVVAVGRTSKLDERILDQDTKEEIGSKKDKAKKAKVEELLARKEKKSETQSEDKPDKASTKQEPKVTKQDKATMDKAPKTPVEDKHIDLSGPSAIGEQAERIPISKVEKELLKAAVIAEAIDRAEARNENRQTEQVPSSTRVSTSSQTGRKTRTQTSSNSSYNVDNTNLVIDNSNREHTSREQFSPAPVVQDQPVVQPEALEGKQPEAVQPEAHIDFGGAAPIVPGELEGCPSGTSIEETANATIEQTGQAADATIEQTGQAADATV